MLCLGDGSMKNRLSLLFLVLTLGTQNGNVCLKSSGIPVQTFAIPEAVFPSSDREALENGISVSSSEALQGLLEDYLS